MGEEYWYEIRPSQAKYEHDYFVRTFVRGNSGIATELDDWPVDTKWGGRMRARKVVRNHKKRKNLTREDGIINV